MTTTPNPTAEQILVDEWIRQADRARSMTGMDAIWFPDAEETLAVLRANGLLSEGTPSEAQIERAARAIRADYVQRYPEEPPVYHAGAGQPVWRHMARAALVAAQGAAPQAHYSEPVMSAPQVESEDNVMCRCGHGTGSHDFSDPQEPCREIVCDCRGWFGVSPVLPSSTESPVEPFKTWFACWWKNEPNAIAESNAQSAFYAGWDARGLPSSGVDEDALAEEIGRHKLVHVAVSRKSAFCMCSPKVTAGVEDNRAWFERHRARAVAEWLKGQGR